MHTDPTQLGPKECDATFGAVLCSFSHTSSGSARSKARVAFGCRAHQSALSGDLRALVFSQMGNIQRTTAPVAAVLLFSSISFALPQHDHGGHSGHGGATYPAPQIRTGKERGRVVSQDENSIKLEITRKGKTVEMAFFLTGNTERRGEVQAGSEVELRYREENGRLLATSIKVKTK